MKNIKKMKNMPILQRTALGNYGEDQHEGSRKFFYKIFFSKKLQYVT